MKKITKSSKLSLNKETISRLDPNEMGSLEGGASSWVCGVVSIASGTIPATTGYLTGGLCLSLAECPAFSGQGLCATSVCGS